MYLLRIVLTATQITSLLCSREYLIAEATQLATDVYNLYAHFHAQCLKTSMPHQRFMADNLHSYINAYSKTTVGHAPQFTSNRKFFANMISTPAFKKMITKDVNALHRNLLEKIKFCDESVVTQDMLKHFYDREVDQNKQ